MYLTSCKIVITDLVLNIYFQSAPDSVPVDSLKVLSAILGRLVNLSLTRNVNESNFNRSCDYVYV